MRFCIALAFQDDEHWLQLYVPLHTKADIDGIVALDGGSSDEGEALLKSYGAHVIHRHFSWNFSEHLNFLHRRCGELGYDALLWLSPDELMFPKEIDLVRKELEIFELLQLRRHNFEEDRLHHMPDIYPDLQWRAWHTGRGVKLSGVVHETVPLKIQAKLNTGTSLANIYHYEGIRRDYLRRENKHRQYAVLRTGGDPMATDLPTSLPEGFAPAWRARSPWRGRQPLNPNKIGIIAPFGKDQE